MSVVITVLMRSNLVKWVKKEIIAPKAIIDDSMKKH